MDSLKSVNRSQPLTVNWTGTGFDHVIIRVQGDMLSGTATHGVTVSCAVPANPGTYTIPAALLAYLPAVATGSQGVGQVSVTAGPNAGGIASAESGTATSVTPSLVGGGQADFGSFTPYIVFTAGATIQ